ncbi:unnamed protein product, partial [Mesorhabditis belari]|uniref:Uncharacterized protein n=1 Tax=Mesorhabditis belari TaxID=2138241 RepID=A0AAF3FIJ1_9BILA
MRMNRRKPATIRRHSGMSLTCSTSTDPSHRNSTGSNSSQGSSGFESMKSTPVLPATTTPSSSFLQSNTPQTSTLDSPPSRISIHSSGSGGRTSSDRQPRYLKKLSIRSLGILAGVGSEIVRQARVHQCKREDDDFLFQNALSKDDVNLCHGTPLKDTIARVLKSEWIYGIGINCTNPKFVPRIDLTISL